MDEGAEKDEEHKEVCEEKCGGSSLPNTPTDNRKMRPHCASFSKVFDKQNTCMDSGEL